MSNPPAVSPVVPDTSAIDPLGLFPDRMAELQAGFVNELKLINMSGPEGPAQFAALLSKYKDLGLEDSIALAGKYASVDGQFAANECYRANTQGLKDQKLFGLINSGMQLCKDVVTSILAFKQMALQGDMIDIADRKEQHQYELQAQLLDYQNEGSVTAAKYDLKKTQIAANVEIQKTKYAADVNKTSIQTRSLSDMFHRRNYPYGMG